MEIVYKNFCKYVPVFYQRLSLVIEGIAMAGQANTGEIAASIAIIKGTTRCVVRAFGWVGFQHRLRR
jgi:hypothetical protein